MVMVKPLHKLQPLAHNTPLHSLHWWLGGWVVMDVVMIEAMPKLEPVHVLMFTTRSGTFQIPPSPSNPTLLGNAIERQGKG
mmetsp:Transcript_8067/g.12999  ORF Transcript_8067/g.12999 Transcript_8067/m.12999 type:complete len:81 (+) Transcript_8067:793-1035(+)